MELFTLWMLLKQLIDHGPEDARRLYLFFSLAEEIEHRKSYTWINYGARIIVLCVPFTYGFFPRSQMMGLLEMIDKKPG